MEKTAATRIQPHYQPRRSPQPGAAEERPYDRAAVEGVMKTVLALSAVAGGLWVIFMIYTIGVWTFALTAG